MPQIKDQLQQEEDYYWINVEKIMKDPETGSVTHALQRVSKELKMPWLIKTRIHKEVYDHDDDLRDLWNEIQKDKADINQGTGQ